MGPAQVIVADTSALLAIQFDEPECREFLTIIEAAERIYVSSVSVVEARMVVYGRHGHNGVLKLNAFLESPRFEIVPPGEAETTAAYEAFVMYGKGNGHPAALNFGDVFSYALSRTRGMPLLFKGNDFSQTDVRDARDGDW
ncbi:type II toxin-antitoxin system VapC family toxin [Mesorhizobium sp. CAU 1732]|uniref:type II toxin-antitoxin system VapC family toxin n=1 Tax=Mesorhizobium sp. CAU 1732 TaxID=3140358 RepID=UPI00326196BA